MKAFANRLRLEASIGHVEVPAHLKYGSLSAGDEGAQTILMQRLILTIHIVLDAHLIVAGDPQPGPAKLAKYGLNQSTQFAGRCIANSIKAFVIYI